MVLEEFIGTFLTSVGRDLIESQGESAKDFIPKVFLKARDQENISEGFKKFLVEFFYQPILLWCIRIREVLPNYMLLAVFFKLRFDKFRTAVRVED